MTPTQKELVLKGYSAFERGDFDEAVRRYEALAEIAPDDPQALYNLATAYARQGETGLAIWRYLQASRLDPRDREIRHNLRVLAPELEQQIAVTPIPPLNWVFDALTTDEWTAIAGGATLLGLLAGALCLRLARGGRARVAVRRIAWLLGLAAVAGYPGAIVHYYVHEVVTRGVVVDEGVTARIGPNEKLIETFALPPGTVVRVDPAPVPDWVKVSFAGGRVGYIPRAAIRYL
jgi:hypothetical protein